VNTKTLLAAAGLVAAIALAGAANADGLPRNWPLPAKDLEKRLSHDNFTIVKSESAGGGVTGASKMTLQFDDGTKIKTKWKAVPEKKMDGWNNCPRKEIATYEIQRWFLDDDNFAVPTTVARSIPMQSYKAVRPGAEPTLAGGNCEVGVFAAWLSDVTAPKDFYDHKRFASDPLYARYLSDFNVLTYLVDHRDGRAGNFLLSTVAGDPRVYAIDNGISFQPFPWNFLVPNWNKMRVPWVRRETVDRLRRVTAADEARLGIVAELAIDQSGVYQDVEPGRNLDPDKGARAAGGHIQFGLTAKEIRKAEGRRVELLREVDSGKLAVH
jgi:hypothetical protein